MVKILGKRKIQKIRIKIDENGKVISKKKVLDLYDPRMCGKLLKVAEKGGHVAAMCKATGIRTEQTFFEYVKKYPEFAEAYTEAKVASKAYYEELALKNASGEIKGNTTALALIMNNKFPDEYKSEKTRAAMEINIGTMNSNNLNVLDQKELDSRIADLQRRLGVTNVLEHKDEDELDGQEVEG